ncbi:MAG: hypothetical protein KDD47_06110 [Acidobacteria bacterium]|nr:hypothetical protein [Acidobacteriota bacterium]
MTLLLWSAAFVALVLAVRRARAEELAGTAPTLQEILLVAAGLRLLLLPLPATLSNDVLRYVWDGRAVVSGHNPYALAPDSESLAGLRDDLWQRMDHRQVPTVYPPLALAAFSWAALMPLPAPGQVVALKSLLAIADLGACAALVYLARRRAMPPHRVLWYAWNPLAALEVAGMGHVEGLGVAATVGAVLWLRRSETAASLAAGAGVLAKLVPLTLIPLWGLQCRRPWVFWALTAGVLVAGLLPVGLSVHGVPPGLKTYGVSWEFNGPIFEPLWRGLDALGSTSAVEGWLDARKSASGDIASWNRWYPFNYPQLHAKLMLTAALGLAVLLLSFRASDAVAGSGRVLSAVLLCSATLYPWYLLWILPWAALCRQRAWLALSGLSLLSYLPRLFPGVELFPWVFAFIWGPFALLFLRFSAWSTD